uniref:Secreted protein n=1 Tax=Mesocestoides corti TaxID=53468 RepID=A0A5K3FNS5_MESCO
MIQYVCALIRCYCTFPTHGMVKKRESKTKGSTLMKAETSHNLVTNRSGQRGKTGSLYILVLVGLFSRWSAPGRCNGAGKPASGLPRCTQRVIQCPRDTTRPEVAPRSHDVANMACFSSSTNGLTPIWLLYVTPLHYIVMDKNGAACQVWVLRSAKAPAPRYEAA